MDDSKGTRRHKEIGALPQWNSRFRFSAQKSSASDGDTQQRTTPGALGPARRVPLAAGAAAADHQRGDAAQPRHPAQRAAGDVTPAEAEKTPTLCLFERFERLTLGTTPSTAAAGAGTRTAAPNTRDSAGSTGSASAASSAGSEQFVTRGARKGRRSVAFGTPSVLAYTPARPAEQEDGAADNTPLWSNAGHTPYSLPGSSHCSMDLQQQQQYNEDAEECEADSSSCDTAGVPLITASRGQHRVSRHSGLRMELFGAVLQEVPEDEADTEGDSAAHSDASCGLAPGSKAAPAGKAAAAAGAAAAAAAQELSAAADSANSSAATAAVVQEEEEDSAACDMQLQTPQGQPCASSAHPKRVTPRAAAASTPGRPGSSRVTAAAARAGASASKPARPAWGSRAAAAAATPATAGKAAHATKTTGPKAASTTTTPASAAARSAGAAARAAGGVRTPAGPRAAATTTPAGAFKAAGAAKAAGSKAVPAAAAVGDAESPNSSGSAFTGFTGGPTAQPQVGSTTPTFFEGNSGSKRGVGSSRQQGGSQLQHLLGARSTASSASSSAAPGSSSKGTAAAAAAATASSRRPGQASRISTPTSNGKSSSRTAVPRTATTAAAAATGTTPVFKAPSNRVAGSAAATPATAPRQRPLCFDAAATAGAEQTPVPAAAAAAVADAGSPVVGMRLPMPTPKSKLRQPERVAMAAASMPVPMELSKLLGDADAAAAAAAVLGPAAGVEGSRPDAVLGSCEVLSPVRARKQVQHALGAADQVLTPVRRSARKVKGSSSSQLAAGHAAAAVAVQPMLEATNYCYQPNEALQR